MANKNTKAQALALTQEELQALKALAACAPALMALTQAPTIADNQPSKKTQKSGKGKAQPKADKPKLSEAEKKAKAEENAQKRLAYKQDKRARNVLTKAENKLVAAQMRAEGKDPSDKQAWEQAKSEYIKANPLT